MNATDASTIAQRFFQAHMPRGTAEPQLEVTSAYQTRHNGIAHVHLRQVIAGIPVANAVANVNIRHGTVLSAHGRLYYDRELPTATEAVPDLSAEEAARRLARFLRLPVPKAIDGAGGPRWRRLVTAPIADVVGRARTIPT